MLNSLNLNATLAVCNERLAAAETAYTAATQAWLEANTASEDHVRGGVRQSTVAAAEAFAVACSAAVDRELADAYRLECRRDVQAVQDAIALDLNALLPAVKTEVLYIAELQAALDASRKRLASMVGSKPITAKVELPSTESALIALETLAARVERASEAREPAVTSARAEMLRRNHRDALVEVGLAKLALAEQNQSDGSPPTYSLDGKERWTYVIHR